MEISIFEALIYSLVPTIISLYLTERVKGKVKNDFDKKLEIVKMKHTLEITKFQAEITSLKTKENFKFTKLHEKRLTVFERIYKLINSTTLDLDLYLSPVKYTLDGQSFKDAENILRLKFIESHNEFVIYYSENKIYLDEKIIELIDGYLIAINEPYNDYSKNLFLRSTRRNVDQETELKAINAYKKIPKKVTPIKTEIEKKFRELLEG
jgi:hypothetical protein